MATDVHTWSIALLLLLWGVGCTEVPEAVDTPVRITASIAPQSRTSMNGSTASFTTNDRIGVFETLTGRTNVPYTYNGSAWNTSTPMYWYNGSSQHSFYAYYPYNATTSGMRVTIPTLSSQTITTSVSSTNDLLAAGPRVLTRTPGVGLTFTHAFALIQFNVKMGLLNLLNPYDLNRVTIRGGNTAGGAARYGIANITGAPAQVGYDLSTAAITATTNDSQSYTQSFYSDISGVSLTTTAVTLYAFVLPGTYSNPVPAVSFRVSLLGLISNSSFGTLSNTTFQAGTKYVYSVSIGLLNRSEELHTTIAKVAEAPIGDNIEQF